MFRVCVCFFAFRSVLFFFSARPVRGGGCDEVPRVTTTWHRGCRVSNVFFPMFSCFFCDFFSGIFFHSRAMLRFLLNNFKHVGCKFDKFNGRYSSLQNKNKKIFVLVVFFSLEYYVTPERCFVFQKTISITSAVSSINSRVDSHLCKQRKCGFGCVFFPWNILWAPEQCFVFCKTILNIA